MTTPLCVVKIANIARTVSRKEWAANYGKGAPKVKF